MIKFIYAYRLSLTLMMFCLSIVALVVNSISVNKLGMLMFILVIFYFTINYKLKFVLNKYNRLLCLFFGSSIVSSLLAMRDSYTALPGYELELMALIIQIIAIYFPIIVFYNNYKQNSDNLRVFKKIFINILRIHASIIAIQFVCYVVMDINIVRLFWENVLIGVDLHDKWNAYVFGDEILIRSSGLNFEPAFASYLMICGYIFDKNMFFRLLYIMAPFFSQSRTGVVTIITLICFECIYGYIKNDGFTKIRYKNFFKNITIFIVFVIAVCTNESLNLQVLSIMERIISLFTTFSDEVSSSLHTEYITKGIVLFFKESNIFNILFGYGPRISGFQLARLMADNNASMVMPFERSYMTWSIECDYVDLLYGCGIVGAFLYYKLILKLFNSKIIAVKEFALSMLLFGWMYNCAFATINVVLLIVLTSSYGRGIWNETT